MLALARHPNAGCSPRNRPGLRVYQAGRHRRNRSALGPASRMVLHSRSRWDTNEHRTWKIAGSSTSARKRLDKAAGPDDLAGPHRRLRVRRLRRDLGIGRVTRGWRVLRSSGRCRRQRLLRRIVEMIGLRDVPISRAGSPSVAEDLGPRLR